MISIQQAAEYVNLEVVGQVLRFIVDDYASTGAPICRSSKRSAGLFVELAEELGLSNHKSKQKVVRARNSAETLEEAGYGARTEFVDGMIFAGQLIADPKTGVGHRFIETFYAAKLA